MIAVLAPLLPRVRVTMTIAGTTLVLVAVGGVVTAPQTATATAGTQGGSRPGPGQTSQTIMAMTLVAGVAAPSGRETIMTVGRGCEAEVAAHAGLTLPLPLPSVRG